jgi:hypothetical protein
VRGTISSNSNIGVNHINSLKDTREWAKGIENRRTGSLKRYLRNSYRQNKNIIIFNTPDC